MITLTSEPKLQRLDATKNESLLSFEQSMEEQKAREILYNFISENIKLSQPANQINYL